MPDEPEIPPAPASRPDSPHAIDRLAQAVEGMSEELRKTRLDLQVVLKELTGVMLRSADHEIRITELEIHSKLKPRRRAARQK